MQSSYPTQTPQSIFIHTPVTLNVCISRELGKSSSNSLELVTLTKQSSRVRHQDNSYLLKHSALLQMLERVRAAP